DRKQHEANRNICSPATYFSEGHGSNGPFIIWTAGRVEEAQSHTPPVVQNVRGNSSCVGGTTNLQRKISGHNYIRSLTKVLTKHSFGALLQETACALRSLPSRHLPKRFEPCFLLFLLIFPCTTSRKSPGRVRKLRLTLVNDQ
ncbi:unnamed protein product, partial [Ectocarpus sp. 12 AP-2014]